MGPLQDKPPHNVDFFEVAPENWIGIGGKMGKDFRHFTERYPFVCHGLSLSIGSPAPLDETETVTTTLTSAPQEDETDP